MCCSQLLSSLKRSRLPWSLLLLAMVAGCERPPVDSNDDAIDFSQFQRDQPAVAGDWYLYEEEAGHLLTPFEHTYVIREKVGEEFRYAALQVESYYDPDTAESGVFTLRVSTYENDAFVEFNQWQTPQNIKSDGPLCLDLFEQQARDCEGNDWQLLLKTYPFVALEGPIVVNRPGLFVRSSFEGALDDVRIAPLEGVRSLSAVDPLTIEELEALGGTADPVSDAEFDAPEQNFGQYAVSFPERGMAISRLAKLEAKNLLFLSTQRNIVKAEFVVDEAQSSFSISRATAELDLRTNQIGEFAAAETFQSTLPSVGDVHLYSLASPDAFEQISDAAFLRAASTVQNSFDFAILNSENRYRVVLSSAAAVYFSDENFDSMTPPSLAGGQ